MAKRIPFSIVFATDEEPEFPSSELNSHGPTVVGWRSRLDSTISPKEIILRFHSPAVICRIQVLAHQYMIPERIELWVHYSPRGAPTTPSSQTYDYLGFITFDQSTNYKSRELQSIPVGPKKGTHLKLRIGPARPNELNTTSQIALIAVNVLGEDLSNENAMQVIQNINNERTESAIASICDDLSFSMYVEETIADVIRKMEMKKSKAVNDERFEYARKLKLCMGALRSAGERLGRYSLAKRQAVQQEDFITAKLRKEQIELYRKSVFDQLQVDVLLELNGEVLSQNDAVSELYAQKPSLPSPPSLQDVASTLTTESTFASLTLSPKSIHRENSASDHSSLITRSPQFGHVVNSPKRSPNTGSLRRRNRSVPRNSYEDYEEQAVPALRHSHTNEFLRECQGAAILENDPCRGRSRLNERERRQAALPILVFGNEMVELFYSRQFQDREDGLVSLTSILKGESFDFSIGVNKIARSATLLLHRAVRDAVFSVFNLAAETVRALFIEFIPDRVSASEVSRCVDRLLPELLAKSGDPSPRIHTLAQHTILCIAACPEVKMQHLIAPSLSRSVGSGTHPRLALSRMQMLEQLVLSQGISTDKQSGLTCRTLSECGCSGIHHPAESVRKVAERVLLLVYKVNPRLVRKQLPPDDDITRRNLLYRQLFTEFDKLDSVRRRELIAANKRGEQFAPGNSSSLPTSPPSNDSPRSKSASLQESSKFAFNGCGSTLTPKNGVAIGSPRKQLEIFKSKSGSTVNETLDNTPMYGTLPKSSAHSSSNGKQTFNPRSPVPNSSSADNSRKSSNSDSCDDPDTDNHCPFCDWTYSGGSEQLDKHYWKACPVLTRCPQCGQVLEVAALNTHLIDECEAKIGYVTCDRCTESVHKNLLEIHQMEDFCTKLKNGTAKCPLCHSEVTLPLVGGWKKHLLGPNGCPGTAKRRSKI